MYPLKHRYKYAISDAGTPIFIDDNTQENRRDTAYTCAGCGRQLFPVLGDVREHHFRHEKDSECSDYNRYLHEYAKAVLKNVDSMEYYNALAAQGDARAQYIMAASYYCSAEAQPLPVGITRVRTRAEADSLLDAAANQGYKPAIKTRECFRECRGDE